MSQEGSKENVLSTTSSAGIRRNSLPLDRTQSDHVDNYYENLDPDKLMNEYGFGRYQWFTYVLCEGMNFFYSSAMYVMPYVGLNPKLECTYKNESVAVDESCRITAENNISLKGVCGKVEETHLVWVSAHYCVYQTGNHAKWA